LSLTKAEEGRIAINIHWQTASNSGHSVPQVHPVQDCPQFLVRQAAAQV
jgi:hypothetical protein